MATPSAKGTVLITGGSGFVGGHLIQTTLEHGFDVRAAVRSDASAAKIVAAFPEAHGAGRLTTAVVAEMGRADSYEAAFSGVEVTAVLHAASPFVLNPQDNVRDLLEPAVHGSLAVLEAARRWGRGVRRVVATSSHAAVVDIAKGKWPGHTYTEDDWNPVTYDEAAVADGVTAYCASKALAERAMWRWVDKSQPLTFDFVAITPPWIFGPYVADPGSTKRLSESVALLWGMVGAAELPPFDFGGYADVREVAEAHVRALEVPEAGGQRFWIGQGFQYQAAADAGRELPELRDRLPAGTPGHLDPDVYKVNGSKATRVLGLQYRTLADTVQDTYRQLLRVEQAEKAAAA